MALGMLLRELGDAADEHAVVGVLRTREKGEMKIGGLHAPVVYQKTVKRRCVFVNGFANFIIVPRGFPLV